MLNRIFLIALMMIPMAARADSANERAKELLVEVNKEGLAAFIRNHQGRLTTRDHDLLWLMADAMEDAAAKSELGQEPRASSLFNLKPNNFFAHDAVLAAPNVQPYTVTFQNDTSELLDEVVAFWQKKDGSPGLPQSIRPVAPRSIQVMVLGICDEMLRYSIGVFNKSGMIMRIPPRGGNVTPEGASSMNPTDHDPCADSWTLFEHQL